MQISRNAKAAPTVVVSEQDAFAGEECRRYLQRIVGGDCPVMTAEPDKPPEGGLIALGATKSANRAGVTAETVPAGGYRILAADSSVVVRGDSKLTTLHGLYHLLATRAGCAWPVAGPEYEVVPQLDELQIPPCDERIAPDLPVRGLELDRYSWTSFDEDDGLMIDWMVKNGMNFGMVGTFQGWERKKARYLKEARERRGLELSVGLHTFNHWLPPDKYFAEHPEYYPLVNGERKATQVCTSNPEVVDIMTRNIAAFLEANPEVSVVGIGANDGPGRWCECPACERIEPLRFSPIGYRAWASRVKSKTYCLFCNKLIERLAPRFPKKRFSILLYTATLAPPEEGVELHPQADALLAFFERMYDRPLAAGITREDYKTMDPDRPQEARYKHYPSILEAWRKITPGRVYLHEYYMGTNATLNMPFPIDEVMREDFRLYRSLGIDGGYTQSAMPDTIAYGLNFYTAAHGARSCDPPQDQVRDEFFRAFYGRHAAAAGELHALLREALKDSHATFSVLGTMEIVRPRILAWLRDHPVDVRTEEDARLQGFYDRVEYAALFRMLYDACFAARDALGGHNVEERDRAVAAVDRIEERLNEFAAEHLLGKRMLHVPDADELARRIGGQRAGAFRMKVPNRYTPLEIPDGVDIAGLGEPGTGAPHKS